MVFSVFSLSPLEMLPICNELPCFVGFVVDGCLACPLGITINMGQCQDCSGSESWPFSEVLFMVAVIHVSEGGKSRH